MKTPIEATPGATVALLNGVTDFCYCDLYAITLSGGTVVRWHSGPMNTPLVFSNGGSSPANGTYLAAPPIKRDKLSTKIGLEVATLDLTIYATPTDLINGAPVLPFARGNGFDGATVVMYRAYLPTWNPPTITGLVIEFSGRVTELKNVSRTQATITISAWTVLLNVNMGPDVYQSGCLNTHYDANCTLTPTNVAGTCGSGSTVSTINSGLTGGNFVQGTITFTSGNNTGLSRAVQSYNSGTGQFTVAYPLPFAPASGDSFAAVRGCLLTMADCTAQSNLIHFRGQPFIPAAVNAITGLPT